MNDLEKRIKAKIPGKDTGIEIKHTMCDICSPGMHCGINAYVKDGKVIKIEGIDGHPANDGKLCTKGLANRQYIYREDRIKTPLRRTGERGEGKFEPISWEEAYKVIAENLNQSKETYGAESVAFYSGYSKWYRQLLRRFCYAFRSPNYGCESSACYTATFMAWKLAAGEQGEPDMEHSDLFLGWAFNPFYSSYRGAQYAMMRKEQGMKFLIVDTRKTQASEKLADLFLQPRTGTDGALAHAIANVLIQRGWIDKEYIEKMIQLPVHIPELSSKDIQNYLLLLVMQKYMKPDSFEVLIKKIEEKKLMIGESAIDYEQIQEILNSESDIYKAGMKNECDEVAKVILQIRSIVAHTLKGNPRQAKRFLNTFITKRQLSKLYYGDKLDMGVMAKLLTLHKLNPDLFDKLNEWNANFDTENQQFKRMRQSLDNDSPDSEFAKWHKPRIKDWVKCPPVELEKKNLNKYFYLTREILKKQDDIESDLSEESRKLLERIGRFNPGLADGIMRDMKELRSSDREDVMKVLIKKIESGDIESNVYSLLFVNFSDYRGEIIEAIKRAAKPLEAGDLPSFKAMYSEDKDAIENLLNELKNVKQEIKDRIMKTGD